MTSDVSEAQLDAVALKAALSSGLLCDLAERTSTVRERTSAFLGSARAAWTGPHADNDLGLVEAFYTTVDESLAEALQRLGDHLAAASAFAAECAETLGGYLDVEAIYAEQVVTHDSGDMSNCGCVDDSHRYVSGEDAHGAKRDEFRGMARQLREDWRTFALGSAAFAALPIVEIHSRAAVSITADGPFSPTVTSGTEYTTTLLALGSGPTVTAADLGLTSAEVVAVLDDDDQAAALLADEDLGFVLAGLGFAELGVLWPSLPASARLRLIGQRPDVAGQLLEVLSPEELAAVEQQLAHPVLTEAFTDKFNLKLGARFGPVSVGVESGSTNDLYVVKLSDGTVLVGVGVEERFGVYAEGNAYGSDISITGGLLANSTHVYQFDTDGEAAGAIAELRAAAHRTGWEVVLESFTGNELDKVMNELGGTNLVSATSGHGGYGSMQVSVDQLVSAGVALSFQATTYRRTEHSSSGSTEVTTVDGILISGTVETWVDVDTTESQVGPGTGVTAETSGSGTFVVDVHTKVEPDGSESSFVTVTVTGAAASTAALELIDASASDRAVSAQRSIEVGTATTIAITLPIDPAQNPFAIAEQVASLDYFGALDSTELDEAEVKITVDVVESVTNEVAIDSGYVGVESSTTETTTTNVSTVHKLPGGDYFSPTELTAEIDELV